MQKQQTFLTGSDLLTNAAPIARRTDHTSSHDAARRVTQSGQRESQKRLLLETVKAHPGLTSKQIAELQEVKAAEIDRYACARRLPDLKADGLVRGERESGQEIRWYPTGGTNV